MKIFVTGATGFIGTALIPELTGAGHQVLGLTRSDEGARTLEALGAEPHSGSIEDLESLRTGAAQADGVIHLAFIHDFSKFQENCEKDRAVIGAIGEVLRGTKKPFVVTSGTAIAVGVDGKPAAEGSPTSAWNPRAASEAAVLEQTKLGVNTSVVRLAQIHDTRKQGLVPYVTAVARAKGVSVYIGEGTNRWPAAHVSDTARLYRLAIYHAVDEEGVTAKEIAEALGRGLKVPVKSITAEESAAHFGFMAMFAGHDMPASSRITRETLGWNPTGPGLIEDLDGMDYSVVEKL